MHDATATAAAVLALLATLPLARAQGQGQRPGGEELGPAKPGAPAGPTTRPGERVRLAYRFEELAGNVAVYRIRNRLTQRKVVQGRAPTEKAERGEGQASSEQTQTYECAFERPESGLGVVRITARRIVVSFGDGQTKAHYDSAQGHAPPQHLAALTSRLGKTARLLVGRDGEVRRITGVPATLRPAYRDHFHELPGRELALGQGWETKHSQPFPPFGTMHHFVTFRLKELLPADADRRARRRVAAKLLVAHEGAGPDHARLRISFQKGEGQLLLDDRGLLLEERLTSEVEYTIKSVAGTEVTRVTSETTRWLTALRKAGAPAGKDEEAEERR